MSDNYYTEKTSLFKLLSDETRLKIINVLINKREELCVNEIASVVGISQSAASHQLNNLENKGIVFSVKTGKTVCYNLVISERVEKIIHLIKT